MKKKHTKGFSTFDLLLMIALLVAIIFLGKQIFKPQNPNSLRANPESLLSDRRIYLVKIPVLEERDGKFLAVLKEVIQQETNRFIFMAQDQGFLISEKLKPGEFYRVRKLAEKTVFEKVSRPEILR